MSLGGGDWHLPAMAGCFGGHQGQATNYAFDSVSRIHVRAAHLSITGILRNTTTPVTVTFVDRIPLRGEPLPVFLNMLEKPGSYYLNLTVDPAAANVGLVSCGLELRN